MFRGTYAYANIAIYPRKGTETYLPPSLAYGSYSTIPVRGRKRCIPTTYQSHVSTIPVRGRKLVRPAVNRCNVGTIPVRGRKLTTHGANAQTATLQFIPARGRKLHVQVKHAHLFHNYNLSPQGDKKHLCHWRLPAAEVLCFFLYSILQVGSCACRNRLCNR